MHRTDGDSYGLNGSDHVYRQESVGSYEATQLTYDAMNAIQEEIANVIEAQGITLNSSSEAFGDMDQLNDAIDDKILNEAVTRAAADSSLQSQITNNATDRNLLWSHIEKMQTDGLLTPTDRTDTGQTIRALQNLLLPVAYIDGFITQRATTVNAGDSLDVFPGTAKDRDNTALIQYDGPGSIGRQVINDAQTDWKTWAAGSGGMVAGADAISTGKWIHLFILSTVAETPSLTICCDTSFAGTNIAGDAALIAAGYTKYRRIGSMIIEGSSGSYAIRDYTQMGLNLDEFHFADNGTEDYEDTSLLTGNEDATLTVPPGILPIALIRAQMKYSASNGVASVLIHSKGTNDTAPDVDDAPLYTLKVDANENKLTDVATLQVPTESTGKIRLNISTSAGASNELRIVTYGWIDPRGRNGRG